MNKYIEHTARILTVTIFLLLILLVVGTVYALVFRTPYAEPLLRFGAPLPQESPIDAPVFTRIGRLRIVTVDNATVVLSPNFLYDPTDIPFKEELEHTVPQFRSITSSFIGSMSVGELRLLHEDLLKEALIQRYNAVLSLGTITTLYLDEYMVIE
ncbi:MAG: hypothetical protein LBQ77_00485 [Treponema sp.]|jgi:flagellar basal body-associated protein FliL|nr:hypothetical protein [Treponema sp.]